MALLHIALLPSVNYGNVFITTFHKHETVISFI